MKQTFKFKVYDRAGLWGSMRVVAPNEDEAMDEVIRSLCDEVQPNGSLSEDFWLRSTNS